MSKELLRRLNKDHADTGLILPIDWWVMILNDPAEPLSRRDKAAEMLAQYTVAKPKPIDSEGSSDNKITVVIENKLSPMISAQSPLPSLPQLSDTLHDTIETDDD